VLERLSRSKRNAVLAVLALVVVWFAWTVRAVLNPLILGYLLAFVLNPMVQRLEERGWGRRSAANMIFLWFFIAGSAIGAVVIWQGRALTSDLARSDFFVEVKDEIESLVSEWLQDDASAPAQEDDEPEVDGTGEVEEGAGVAHPPAGEESPVSVEAATFQRLLNETLARLREGDTRRAALESAGEVWPYVRAFFGSVVALATLVMLLPIYAYFLLFELDRIHAYVYRYIPRPEKDRFARIATAVGEVLANFFRGRLLVCLLKGLLISVGLLLVGVKYAFFLGLGSGFLALVPFVGPMAGFLVAWLLATFPPGGEALAAGIGWGGVGWALLRTGSVFAVAEILEGYVLLPKILGDSLGLHPVVVLASVFVGGAALGMFGFLIALPLTAALVIVARELVMPALGDFADEEPSAAEEEGAAPET